MLLQFNPISRLSLVFLSLSLRTQGGAPEDSHVSRAAWCKVDSCPISGPNYFSSSGVETVSGYPVLAVWEKKAILTSHGYISAGWALHHALRARLVFQSLRGDSLKIFLVAQVELGNLSNSFEWTSQMLNSFPTTCVWIQGFICFGCLIIWNFGKAHLQRVIWIYRIRSRVCPQAISLA